MRNNSFFSTTLRVMGVMLLTSLLLVGCKKDNDTNDNGNGDDNTPELANTFVVGNDTTTITTGMLLKVDECYEFGFVCQNGTSIALMSRNKPEAGTDTVADMMFVYGGGYGYYIQYYNNTGDTGDELIDGTVTIKSIDALNCQISFKGHNSANEVVSFYYKGAYYDVTQAMGTGTFTILGQSYSFDRGYCAKMNGYYDYSFTNDDMNNSFDIFSKEPLKNGTVYNIVSNDNELLPGQVNFDYDIYGEEESICNNANSGTLQCLLDGETYTLTICGSSDDGDFTCTYTGKCPLIALDKSHTKQLRKR